MSWYRYRHILLIFFVMMLVFLAYVIDFRSLRDEYDELSSNEARLSALLLSEHEAAAMLSIKHFVNPEKSALLRELLQLLHQHAIEINSLTRALPAEGERASGEYFHLKLKSNYVTLMRFLRGTMRFKSRCHIRQFAVSTLAHDKLNIEMAVRLTSEEISKQDKSQTQNETVRIPFCSSLNQNNFRLSLPDSYEIYSIYDLRLLGFIDYQNKKSALILFPDGKVRSVNSNATLGSEHALAAQFHADSVMLVLPDKTRYFLSMAVV